MSKPITQLTVKEFTQLESASGLLLLGATIIALVFANTQLTFYYEKILGTPVAIQVGALAINKPLLLWINDGLMAIFFFLVSLEIKREFLEGELSSLSQVILPGMGALGGMIVSASIYIWFNWGDPEALSA
jgi:NhaA family Na+:H+ antiporter